MSIVILTKERIWKHGELVVSMLEVCIPVAFLCKTSSSSFSANLEVKMGTSKLLVEET